MADFDGNPFADPEVNPFAVSLSRCVEVGIVVEANFPILQDPAVQEATAPVKDGQEEYNPFSEEPKAKDPEVRAKLRNKNVRIAHTCDRQDNMGKPSVTKGCELHK